MFPTKFDNLVSWLEVKLWKFTLIKQHAFKPWLNQSNSLDGRMVRTSASGAVDSGLIPSRVKPMTLKLVFTASLLDPQQ